MNKNTIDAWNFLSVVIIKIKILHLTFNNLICKGFDNQGSVIVDMISIRVLENDKLKGRIFPCEQQKFWICF